MASLITGSVLDRDTRTTVIARHQPAASQGSHSTARSRYWCSSQFSDIWRAAKALQQPVLPSITVSCNLKACGPVHSLQFRPWHRSKLLTAAAFWSAVSSLQELNRLPALGLQLCFNWLNSIAEVSVLVLCSMLSGVVVTMVTIFLLSLYLISVVSFS